MNDGRLAELQRLLPRCLTHDWVRLGARLVRLLRDRLHPARHDEVLERLLEQARRSAELCELRRTQVPRITYPDTLPITARKDDIVAAIRAHPVVVIAGETGSGKTTQIPKMCLEAGLGLEAMIGCTQPRRVAALSISQRLAEELNVAWGREVGCKIRFDDRTNSETYIKLMTDGILLAETQTDPLLAEYNALIIDEAHERSLNIDFLLGYLQGLLAQRPDLKLIITSATIDTKSFSRAFNDAPIIEVSGRTFPVEVVYEPLDPESEERGDQTFVDAAVRAAGRVLEESTRGDVLIFLPGERDIREAADQLAGRLGAEAEVIPLFGRLSGGDQQRVFAPSLVRKIVVATNIAETSLTIPGIRFVIDAGLARLSRYNPRTRTKRLPIEPVSQSSANQRKGRAGRVEAGVCIRLYSEEDFNARPPHTLPEIQRANLAEVILRMKAFRLGEIETFPFLNPPPPSAISGGYTLLHELGALDPEHNLTPLGHQLARLPIDPTLGRMLLQAHVENATRELLIIASALSIQDPRERPLEQQAAADMAHRRHAHPQSDFLGLLSLWNAVHQEWEALRTQGQRRRFCRANFLSYLRMREWQDLHAQLEGALDDLVLPTIPHPERSSSPAIPQSASVGIARLGEPTYDAIHRSILAGLLGHVAVLQERNQFKTSGNREVMLFPGSALFVRGESPRKGASARPPAAVKPAKTSQPSWIVAGEIVETSQLFARTVAAINPEWIADLAPHLVKISHQHPRWIASAGQVLIDEIATLHGLEVRRRRVAFSRLDPKEATALFVRAALVEEALLPSHRGRSETEESESERDLRGLTESALRMAPVPERYEFLAHNRRLREKIENWQTRVRHHGALDADQALCDFYASRLANVSSVAELDRWLREATSAEALYASEKDLTGGRALTFDDTAFPDAVALSGQPVALRYAYAPGEAHDGVTVRLPFALAEVIPTAILDWSVPGLRAGLVDEWLRALPKSARRQLQPIPPKVEEIVRELKPHGPTLGHDFASYLREKYGVQVVADDVAAGSLAPHLRPRVEVVGPDQRVLASGRDLAALRRSLPQTTPAKPTESAGWQQVAQRWERFGLTEWSFGDVPERLEIPEAGPLPQFAWPGLEVEGEQVNLRLFMTPETARRATAAGVRCFVERVLNKDLAWLEKDLRTLTKLAALYEPLGSLAELQATAFENLRRFVLQLDPLLKLERTAFEAAVAQAKGRLPGLAIQLQDKVAAILEHRRQVAERIGGSANRSPTDKSKRSVSLNQLSQWLTDASRPATTPLSVSPWTAELSALVPPRFLAVVPFERLTHLPRYLKALLLRVERAAVNPPKDAERARQLAPWVSALRQFETGRPEVRKSGATLDEFRWLIEEFKVSLFAQELGTAIPVSAQRLADYVARLQSG